MKSIKIMLVILILFVSALLVADTFFKGIFYDKTVIVSFNTKAIPNLEGDLPFSLEDGTVKTGLKSFDIIAKKYQFVGLERFISFVKDKNWIDKDGTRIQNIYRVKLSSNDNIEEALGELKKNEHIIYASYETIDRIKWSPNDPSMNFQWYLEKIECENAWDIHQEASQVKIGIVDSGVQWIHPDLKDNIYINEAENTAGVVINWEDGTISGGDGIDNDGNGKIDDVIGWNVYDNSNNTNQNFAANSHGTHVAGCAAAVTNNAIGVASPSVNAKIMIVTCQSTYQGGNGIVNGYNGIMYCADSGAKIINCSWGGPTDDMSYSNNIVNYASSHGSLVIAAAGNGDSAGNGIEHGAPFSGVVNDHYYSTSYYQDSPADCLEAVCVAATTQDDSKSGFSDYGLPIDISSPGVSIYSTVNYGNGYDSLQGTSMASPITAGVAALVLGKFPDASVNTLRNKILESADNIDEMNPDYVGKLGSGRVNLFSSLAFGYIPKLSIVGVTLEEYNGNGDGIPNLTEEIKINIELFNANGWLDAENVVATLSSDLEGVEFIDNTSNYNYILNNSSYPNLDDPFIFKTLNSLSEYKIPFKLSLTADAEDGFVYEDEINFEIELSIMHTGWPIEMNNPTTSSGLFADLDGDNDSEFIFCEYNGDLKIILDSPTNSIITSLGSIVSAPVAVGNLDSDPELEIVVGLEDGNVKVVNHDGTISTDFSALVEGDIKASPVISDVNGDGSNEIIISSWSTGKLYIFDSSGNILSNFPVDAGARANGLAVGDINNDGNKEVVLFGLFNGIEAISSSTGENISGFPVNKPTSSQSAPTIANLDDDPELEILVTNNSRKLYGIDNDGSELFSEITVQGQTKTNIIVADLDNDEELEFIFASTAGKIYGFEKNGIPMDNFPFNIGEPITSSPVLSDFIGGDEYEIIFGTSRGKLYAVDLNGNNVGGYPLNIGGNISVGLAIGDIDNDGDSEIAVTQETTYMMIDRSIPLGTSTWRCLHGTIGRTNNAVEVMSDTPIDYITEFPEMTQLSNNYPNPFNPKTRISYSLPKASNINISVYNVKGQKVKTLINGYKNKGEDFVIWNGKDDQNNMVSSGLYFYKLETESAVITKKMILMK